MKKHGVKMWTSKGFFKAYKAAKGRKFNPKFAKKAKMKSRGLVSGLAGMSFGSTEFKDVGNKLFNY